MTMTLTKRRSEGRKAKRSFTLSVESVDFLEAMRKKHRALSVSAALEDILQSVKREQERAAMEKAVADYYSSLSDEEVEEQRAWGDLSTREFSRLDP